MAKFSINLLPAEVIAEELKKSKFYKVQLVGVVIILFLAFLASTTVALRILQSHNISQVQAQVASSQQRVTELKSTQASLVLLKNRLTAISEHVGVISKEVSMYKLIDKLIPSQAVVNSIDVDNLGQVSILVLITDAQTLDNLVNNLTNSNSNENQISQVSVDSLNRGKDGVYRVSFKIKPK